MVALNIIKNANLSLVQKYVLKVKMKLKDKVNEAQNQ